MKKHHIKGIQLLLNIGSNFAYMFLNINNQIYMELKTNNFEIK